MKTIETIFNAAGGSGAMARILGVKPSAASEMRRRGSVPVPYWPKLIAHFKDSEKHHLDSDTLVRIHVAKKRKAKAALKVVEATA